MTGEKFTDVLLGILICSGASNTGSRAVANQYSYRVMCQVGDDYVNSQFYIEISDT